MSTTTPTTFATGLPAMPSDGAAVINPALNPTEGATAFQELEPKLRALPAESVISPYCSTPHAAVAALQLATNWSDPSRAEAIALIPIAMMKGWSVNDLRTIGVVTWYLEKRADTVDATSTYAQVDPSIVLEGQGVKSRMMRVLGYHFHDDP